jgi:hypothetical protein
MNKHLPKITKKLARPRFLSLFLVSVLVLALFSDVLFLLFGGEYLAEQMIPPLPINSVMSECFSQHTVLCKNIGYTTSYSPQNILGQWSTSIYQNENLKGEIIYHSKKCNESWLGLHYAYFHKRHEPACATISAWSEYNSNITHVFIQLSWSVCPDLVNKYFLHAPYFRCFEG